MGNSLSNRPEFNLEVNLVENINSAGINNFDPLVNRCKKAISDVSLYKGCGSIIQSCYKNGGDEDLLLEGFISVLKNASMIVSFHSICLDISVSIKQLASNVFHSNSDKTEMKFCNENKGLNDVNISYLIYFINFMLEFDFLKSKCPDIQNDFSYFKRELNSNRMQSIYMNPKYDTRISSQMTNTSYISTVSMWLAESYPMTRHLKYFWRNDGSENAPEGTDTKEITLNVENLMSNTQTFAILANMFCCMLHRKVPYIFDMENKVKRNQLILQHIQAMTCSAIMFDILSSSGSTKSNNMTDSIRTSSSIFAVGSLVKTTKILAMIQLYCNMDDRSHFYDMIKYCSMTYLNKNNKPKIMQLMDTK